MLADIEHSSQFHSPSITMMMRTVKRMIKHPIFGSSHLLSQSKQEFALNFLSICEYRPQVKAIHTLERPLIMNTMMEIIAKIPRIIYVSIDDQVPLKGPSKENC